MFQNFKLNNLFLCFFKTLLLYLNNTNIYNLNMYIYIYIYNYLILFKLYD